MFDHERDIDGTPDLGSTEGTYSSPFSLCTISEPSYVLFLEADNMALCPFTSPELILTALS
ncbi:hypothetical protein ACQP3F_31980, partial [Escherichia coli]